MMWCGSFFVCFFKQKTAYELRISDWSSDVCSSDLFGFSVYPIAARRVGAKPVEAPDRDYATDVDAMLAAVTERTRVVFLANPNNPTGTFASRDEIARLHKGLPQDVLLVIDQAYAEYLEPEAADAGLEQIGRAEWRDSVGPEV